jgi:hypothetical protein
MTGLREEETASRYERYISMYKISSRGQPNMGDSPSASLKRRSGFLAVRRNKILGNVARGLGF